MQLLHFVNRCLFFNKVLSYAFHGCIRKGIIMNNEVYLDVNDYLDLYLLAEKLGDVAWQQEIKEKLRDLPSEAIISLHRLRQKYKQVSTELLALLKQAKLQPFDKELRKQIWYLKQQQMELNREIINEEQKVQRQKP